MPTSNSTENPKVSVNTVAELAGVEAASLSDGDLAFVLVSAGVNAPRFFYLNKGDTSAVDNVAVVATKDAALGALPATPGRWLRTNIVAA